MGSRSHALHGCWTNLVDEAASKHFMRQFVPGHKFHFASTNSHGTDMAPPRGSAAYKKQDGTLAISKDGQSVSWTPVTPPGAKAALTLAVSAITS
ncbi:MAG: hypothetical protein Q9183_002346 [Haloplaca sp. 2 TL-2023]